MDQHSLQCLAVQVEGLLAEVVDTGAQVVDGGVGIEVAEFLAPGADTAGHLEQAVVVVGYGAHRPGAGRIAAQGAANDDSGDDAVGLALGRILARVWVLRRAASEATSSVSCRVVVEPLFMC